MNVNNKKLIPNPRPRSRSRCKPSLLKTIKSLFGRAPPSEKSESRSGIHLNPPWSSSPMHLGFTKVFGTTTQFSLPHFHLEPTCQEKTFDFFFVPTTTRDGERTSDRPRCYCDIEDAAGKAPRCGVKHATGGMRARAGRMQLALRGGVPPRRARWGGGA
jgi:hypothetical protein